MFNEKQFDALELEKKQLKAAAASAEERLKTYKNECLQFKKKIDVLEEALKSEQDEVYQTKRQIS